MEEKFLPQVFDILLLLVYVCDAYIVECADSTL